MLFRLFEFKPIASSPLYLYPILLKPIDSAIVLNFMNTRSLLITLFVFCFSIIQRLLIHPEQEKLTKQLLSLDYRDTAMLSKHHQRRES